MYLRALLLLALPFATAVWHVYTLIFVLNAATAFFSPTYEASIPTVVGKRHVVQALSLSRVAVDVEAVAAPVAAGVIVAVVGARWVFWFDSATYLLSACLVLCVTIPRAAAQSVPLSFRAFAAEITYGTRLILREASLRLAILLSFSEALAGAAVIVGTAAYVQQVLVLGEVQVAVAMGAVGVGSSLAAVILSRATGRHEMGARGRARLHQKRHEWSHRALLLGAFGLGLALVPCALTPPLAGLVVLWALNGAGQALIAIPSSTLLAEHSSEKNRGRIYAAHFALTHVFWLATYPAVGHAASRWGTARTFTGAGAVCLAVALVATSFPRVSQRHDHRPTDPS